jgi:hypothetical protein
MWSSVHLSTTQVWDSVLWTVTATWRDDDTTEPVALVKSGQAPLYDLDSPLAILRAALQSLERESEWFSASSAT